MTETLANAFRCRPCAFAARTLRVACGTALPAAAALALAGLAPASTAGQEGADPPPRIRVEGNRFVGPDGETVALRGFSFSDPDKLAREGHWNRALFEEARNRWNANVVRLPVHPAAWRERGEEAYLTLLDSALRWAEQTSLYVIIDWHSIGNLRTELFQNPMYNTTKTETLRFWKSIAARYGNSRVVAFYELFNEPTTFNGTLGRITWDEYKGYMEEIIDMIRAHGAQGIPLVAGFDWAYDLTEPAANPIDAPGVAYVTHPYPQKRPPPWEERWQADWGFMAERYPVMVTEFGFMSAQDRGAHIPVIADTTYGEAIIDFLEPRGIAWIAWVFDPDWSPQLIEDWEFTPTMEGRFFREKMMALNPRRGTRP
jgi:endoglucanase